MIWCVRWRAAWTLESVVGLAGCGASILVSPGQMSRHRALEEPSSWVNFGKLQRNNIIFLIFHVSDLMKVYWVSCRSFMGKLPAATGTSTEPRTDEILSDHHFWLDLSLNIEDTRYLQKYVLAWKDLTCPRNASFSILASGRENDDLICTGRHASALSSDISVVNS